MSSGSLFDYTQRAYWGGPWYPYWTLIVISIFGGLFGLDHFWLRSPSTGFAKAIINIFTLGLWYVYDLVQILGEKESVMKHGLSVPIVGATGIGSGMFVDNQPGTTTSKSPLRYMAYLFLVLLPFGFDMYIAGDTYGALAKFVCAINPLFWIIGFIWYWLTIGQTIFTPKSVFETGTTRMFPFTWLMSSNGRSILGPREIPTPTGKCNDQGVVGAVAGTVGAAIAPVVTAVIPGAAPAQAAATAVSGVVEHAANFATSIINATKGPATHATEVASNLVQKVPDAVSATGNISGKVGSELKKFSTEEGLKSIINSQSGGGSGSTESIALLMFFLTVLGFGSAFAAARLNVTFPFFRRTDGQERNDSPPKPHGLRGNASPKKAN
jgi:hypothetical protein